MWGTELFPWQRHVLDVAHERDPNTGKHVYDTVVMVVGRRAGKSIGALAQDWTFAARPDWWQPGMSTWRSAYTAQNSVGAIKRLRQTWEMFQENAPPGMRQATREMRAAAQASVEMRWQGRTPRTLNPRRSRIHVFAPTRHGLRGDTYAVAKIDEVTALTVADGEALQDAVRPTLADQDGQLWWLSNLSIEDGGYLPTLMQRGRAAVEQNRTDGIAYFEWSAPHGSDIHDPLVWADAHPALGVVLTESRLRRELEEQGPTRFAAEYLNMPDAAGIMLTPAMWKTVTAPVGTPPNQGVWLAADITPDRMHAAISIAWTTTDGQTRAGILWTGPTEDLAHTLADAETRHQARIIYDPITTSPAAQPHWQRITAATYAEACARMVDLVRSERIRIREDPALTAAAAGAQARPMGDGWVWGRRRSTINISTLVSLTLAAYGARTQTIPTMV